MSPPFEASLASIAKQEYIPEERKFLLEIAHDAISSLLGGRELSIFTPSPHLSEPRGARMGPHYLPRSDLPQSRIAADSMENRSRNKNRSLHRRSFWRPGIRSVEVVFSVSEPALSAAEGW